MSLMLKTALVMACAQLLDRLLADKRFHARLPRVAAAACPAPPSEWARLQRALAETNT